MDEQQFSDGVKAVVALLTSLVTGISAYVGLPGFISPEVIAAVGSAVSAVGGLYFLIRRKAVADAAAKLQ